MSNPTSIVTLTPKNYTEYGCRCFLNPKHEGHLKKLEWLKERFSEGLTIKHLFIEGEKKPIGFIEYVPGEYAWRAVDANSYLFIHCIWISPNKNKEKGYGSQLVGECIEDARKAGKGASGRGSVAKAARSDAGSRSAALVGIAARFASTPTDATRPKCMAARGAVAAIAAAETPVEWVVIDASPVNVVDATAVKKFDQLREELAARNIVLAVAGKKHNVQRMFEGAWVDARTELAKAHNFRTLKLAMHAFEHRGELDPSGQRTG